MANMLQSSQTQATTAPSYYTDYLSNLASAGKSAVDPTTGAKFIGANSLQTTAFNDADTDTSNYTTQLGNAGTTLGNVGSATSPLTAATSYLTDATSNPALAAQQYMNPNIVRASVGLMMPFCNCVCSAPSDSSIACKSAMADFLSEAFMRLVVI